MFTATKLVNRDEILVKINIKSITITNEGVTIHHTDDRLEDINLGDKIMITINSFIQEGGALDFTVTEIEDGLLVGEFK